MRSPMGKASESRLTTRKMPRIQRPTPWVTPRGFRRRGTTGVGRTAGRLVPVITVTGVRSGRTTGSRTSVAAVAISVRSALSKSLVGTGISAVCSSAISASPPTATAGARGKCSAASIARSTTARSASLSGRAVVVTRRRDGVTAGTCVVVWLKRGAECPVTRRCAEVIVRVATCSPGPPAGRSRRTGELVARDIRCVSRLWSMPRLYPLRRAPGTPQAVGVWR